MSTKLLDGVEMLTESAPLDLGAADVHAAYTCECGARVSGRVPLRCDCGKSELSVTDAAVGEVTSRGMRSGSRLSIWYE